MKITQFQKNIGMIERKGYGDFKRYRARTQNEAIKKK
jgi:hypothetical protein